MKEIYARNLLAAQMAKQESGEIFLTKYTLVDRGIGKYSCKFTVGCTIPTLSGVTGKLRHSSQRIVITNQDSN